MRENKLWIVFNFFFLYLISVCVIMVIVFESNIGIGFRFDWFIDIWDKKGLKLLWKFG